VTEKDRLKVLAVGAHPDDIELGCGGTLRRHILKGDEVVFIIASLGERNSEGGKRRAEALRSAELLGVKAVHFLNLPDTMIRHDGETVSKLDKFVHADIDVVYVHSPRDYHQDHANIAASVLSASRNWRNSIFFYETPTTTIEFRPALYVDITDVFDTKIECIRQYFSQQGKEYMEEQAIFGLAKYRGYSLRVEYAEAFEVGRLKLFD
jgi:LmbE family N-acetylglucosaminyl deacetylase